MNVSKKADAAFVLELRREDPARSARIMKSMERALGHGSGEHWFRTDQGHSVSHRMLICEAE